MLRHLVIQPINGATDWYDLAAFSTREDAEDWCATYNNQNEAAEFPAKIVPYHR